MADRLRFTILGCGSSPGTPRITGDWGDCDPSNPKNRRTRAAAMVERIAPAGTTRVIIDTGPDFREQMLAAAVTHIDAAVYTHPHADHIHGIDDLRGYVLEQRRMMDIHADAPTLERLRHAFGYCFETPEGSSYPPILKAHVIDHERPVVVAGKGGPVVLTPLPQRHGEIISLGFRIANLAYCPDVSDFPEPTVRLLAGLDILVIDALQLKPHPSHLSLPEALDWIRRIAPARAVLTHMHTPLDYEALRAALPGHIVPAYDGMVLDLPYLD